MTDTENTPAPEAATAAAPIDTAPETAAPETAAPAVDSGDVPPDHLCIHPWSAHHDADKLGRGIGIRFKGAVRTNVEEYCISKGWIKVQAGKSLDRKGRPMLLTLKGPVEAWYEDLGDNPPIAK